MIPNYKKELEGYIEQFNTRFAYIPTDPIKLGLISEQKPSNYFIKDIYNRDIKLPCDNDVSESWFVEIFANDKCLFRQSTTNYEQINLHEYEDDLCERLLIDIFNAGIINVFTNSKKYAPPYPAVAIKPNK